MTEEAANLLITGRPGVGKTTALLRAAGRFDDLEVRGFLTEETRDEAGRRTGFEIVTLDGDRRALAHVDIPGSPRVSRYGVDVKAVDRVTADELERTAGGDVYLIDEIGKMECYSDRFVEAVRRLAADGRPLVATVAARGGGLIQEVKEHSRSELWTLTEENRDRAPERIAGWVRERAGS